MPRLVQVARVILKYLAQELKSKEKNHTGLMSLPRFPRVGTPVKQHTS